MISSTTLLVAFVAGWIFSNLVAEATTKHFGYYIIGVLSGCLFYHILVSLLRDDSPRAVAAIERTARVRETDPLTYYKALEEAAWQKEMNLELLGAQAILKQALREKEAELFDIQQAHLGEVAAIHDIESENIRSKTTIQSLEAEVALVKVVNRDVHRDLSNAERTLLAMRQNRNCIDCAESKRAVGEARETAAYLQHLSVRVKEVRNLELAVKSLTKERDELQVELWGKDLQQGDAKELKKENAKLLAELEKLEKRLNKQKPGAGPSKKKPAVPVVRPAAVVEEEMDYGLCGMEDDIF
jgi:hypothetical protein